MTNKDTKEYTSATSAPSNWKLKEVLTRVQELERYIKELIKE